MRVSTARFEEVEHRTQASARHHVEDHVEPSAEPRDVVRSVVDEIARTHRAHERLLVPGVDTGDLGAQHLRDLDAVAADDPARAVHQDPLPRLDIGLAQEVQRVDRSERHRRGLGERHRRGLVGDRRLRRHGDELGVRAAAQPGRSEHRVADREALDAIAERLDHTGAVHPEDGPARPEHAERDAERYQVPLDRLTEAAHLAVGLRRLRRLDADQQLTGTTGWRVDLHGVQDIGPAVPLVGNGPHGSRM